MNDEKWQDLKDKIENRFGKFESHIKSDILEDDIGNKISQKIESLEFDSPLGNLKIERTVHPKIIDRKAHYHKSGGGADMEFVVSEDEFSYKVSVFKKDDFGNWQPLDLPPEKFSL